MKLLFFILILVLSSAQASNGLPPPLPLRRQLRHYYEKFKQTSTGRPSQETEGRVVYPVRYGADPTGSNDSTGAIVSALEDAFSLQRKGLEMLQGISDLGGVILDFQGGNYKISKPIRFPPGGGGNLVIQGGTLRASEDFPVDDYLVELWSSSSSRNPKFFSSQTAQVTHEKLRESNISDNKIQRSSGIYYEDVTFRDILFDSGHRGGGLLVVDSARTRVDNCFFLHFSTDGILIEGGHETFISSSFLGKISTVGGDPRERNFSGTAINIASNDNAVTDVVIFSAAIGVILRGQANILTGVHCYNKATAFGGVGIYVKLAGLSQTRIDNCYLDYNGIVLEDPVQVHITNAFFLGDANIVLKSIKGKISGLNIVDNMFSGKGWRTPIVRLDESNGKFSSVDQVVIDRNNVLEMNLKSTVVRKTVAGKGKRWVADMSQLLVFPGRINHVQYSLYVKGGGGSLVAHAVTAVGNNTVVVEAAEEVDAVVSVVVDQYIRPGETNYLL